MLKKTQNYLFNMLSEVISIFEKYDLQYYLIGGTLLGAIRHQGFIPWDDDIDIAMPRNSYDKLVKLRNDILPEHLLFKDAFNDDNFPSFHGKIINKNTTMIIKTKTKLRTGIFIDIFPIDNIDNELTKAKKTINKIKRIRTFYTIRNGYYNIEKDSFIVSKILRPILKVFTRNKHYLKKVERIIAKKTKKESIHVASYFGAWLEKDIYNKKWVNDIIKVNFNGLKVNAPIGFDELLRSTYGDYMVLPAVENRITHHFIEKIDFNTSFVDEKGASVE